MLCIGSQTLLTGASIETEHDLCTDTLAWFCGAWITLVLIEDMCGFMRCFAIKRVFMKIQTVHSKLSEDTHMQV